MADTVALSGRCPICYQLVMVPYQILPGEDGGIEVHLIGTYPVHNECRPHFQFLQAVKGGHGPSAYETGLGPIRQ